MEAGEREERAGNCIRGTVLWVMGEYEDDELGSWKGRKVMGEGERGSVH